MKKFYLFLAVMLTTISAQASTPKKFVRSEAQQQLKKHTMATKESAQATPFADFQATEFVNQLAKAPLKAEETSSEAIDVTFYKLGDNFYDAKTKDWFFGIYAETEELGMIVLKLDFWTDNSENPSGHYDGVTSKFSQGKMCSKYTKWVPYYITDGRSEEEATVYFTKVNLDLDVKEDGELNITGYLQDAEGKYFHLDLHKSAPIKPDYEKNLTLTAKPEKSYLSSSVALFAGYHSEEDLFVQVAVNGLEGEYTEGQVNKDYTAVFWDIDAQPAQGAGIIEQDTARVTYDETTRTYDLYCTFIGATQGEDDKYTRYRINMTLALPEAKDTVAISLTNAEFQSFWGYTMASADNEEYAVQVSYGSVDDNGDIDLSMFNASVSYTDEKGQEAGCLDLIPYSGHVESDEAGKPIITASFYGNDYRQYDIDLRFVLPTPTDTLHLTMNGEYTNYLEKYSAQRINGYTVDEKNDTTRCFSFITYGNEVAGSWDMNDGMLQGQLYDFAKQKTYKIYTGTLDVTVDWADSTIVAKGQFLASDAVVYDIEIRTKWAEYEYEKLEYDCDNKADSVDVSFTNEDVNQLVYNGDEDSIYLNAWNKTRNDVCTLGFMAMKEEGIVIPTGEYPIKDDYSFGTVTACPGVEDGVLYPSYYAKKTEDGTGLETPLWQFVDGKVTVTRGTGTNLTIVVDAINSYKVPVHIVIDLDPSSVEAVTVDGKASFNGKKIENGQLVIFKNNQKFTVAGQLLK